MKTWKRKNEKKNEREIISDKIERQTRDVRSKCARETRCGIRVVAKDISSQYVFSTVRMNVIRASVPTHKHAFHSPMNNNI